MEVAKLPHFMILIRLAKRSWFLGPIARELKPYRDKRRKD